jgi:hypothetical protein
MAISVDLSSLLADLNPWWREPGARRALAWPVRRGVHRRLLEGLGRPEEWRAQVLLGPRQVGKTTLLKQLADDLLDRGWPPRNLTYFDLEDFRLKRDVDPAEIVELRPPGAEADLPQVFLLDELQHMARWDRWLKYAVDNRVGRIVATGSASSLLREGGRESGLGRWDEILLEGLTFREFSALTAGLDTEGDTGGEGTSGRRGGLEGDPELVERYLALGGFPAHAMSGDPSLVRERLRTDVVDRAIRRDLGGQVEDPERLRRLFVYLAQQSGAEQNASDRADDLGLDPRTVSRWIDLLEDTFLIAALPRGTASAKAAARLRGRPKLYAADHGLITAFAETSPGDSEVRSRVFEAVVYRHLREVARARGGEVRYLRWANELEVDFVLEAAGERIAIEVTHSAQPRADKRRTLERAADRAGANRSLLIHGGLAYGDVEGVAFVPLARFLGDPASTLFGGPS